MLLCTEFGRQRSLDLDLYLTDEGPLLPKGADPGELKEDPRVEVANDGDVFPVQLFADDYLVVTDSQTTIKCRLCRKALDALQRGESMTGALRSA